MCVAWDAALLTPLDRLLEVADAGLRASFARPESRRPTPGPPVSGTLDRNPPPPRRGADAGQSRGRNRGPGALSRAVADGPQPETREALRRAADEEGDHLAWCRDRLDELGSRPSLLDPLWYAGSVAIGALAGLCGDRASLGFMAETESQVEGHLATHLERLPPEDPRSRAIIEQMQADEIGPWPRRDSPRAAKRCRNRCRD